MADTVSEMPRPVPDEGDRGQRLYISEVFLTVCGEGSEVGLPAVFVRTSGCNLRCPGWPCDTPYTSVSPQGTWQTPGQVLEAIQSFPCRRVFLTGGEPLLWHEPLAELCRALKARGCEVLLQSNGTRSAPALFRLCDLVSLDDKTPSSGEVSSAEVIGEVIQGHPRVQVKYAIRDETDLGYAVERSRVFRSLPGGERVSYCLQPVDEVGRDERDSLLRKLQWLQRRVLEGGLDWFRVLPQVHVLLHGSAARGV